MTDDELEGLLRDAARTYRRPPELADPDATWRAIEHALDRTIDGARPDATRGELPRTVHDAATRDARGVAARLRPWARMAAVLLVGVALGRWTARATPGVSPGAAPVVGARAVAAATPAVPDDAAAGGDALTAAYLGRIETLLAELPAELRARRDDPRAVDVAWQSRADALLLQTRLMLDSPAAADPALRALFDDLEIVLAQAVRLDAVRDPTGIDFLAQALEQRDVLPRLRDATADHSGD